MFDHKHYVPILKAKEGEFKGLQEASNAVKLMMTPLFEIVNIPWDYEDDEEAKTINEHLQKIGEKIRDGWGVDKDFFVDSNLIEGNRVMTDGITHHLVYLFNDFRAKTLQAIPVTGLVRHPDYKRAVRDISQQDGRGIALRLQNSDLAKIDLTAMIDADMNFYGITPTEVDLVIDIGSINNGNADLLVLTIATCINNTLPYINDWRTLTISASSFPSDLSDIAANTIDTIERVEWEIWNRLLATRLARIPTFSDYTISHPETIELDPRNMRVSASIRYTCNDYWLIVRGQWLRRFGYNQYHNLCANLVRRGEYDGAAFSWGDEYIDQCARNLVGTGNPTTWRKVGNNHHFHKVVRQISSLP